MTAFIKTYVILYLIWGIEETWPKALLLLRLIRTNHEIFKVEQSL